jgi:murein L,D-transpeptidase YcbB/YkuD
MKHRETVMQTLKIQIAGGLSAAWLLLSGSVALAQQATVSDEIRERIERHQQSGRLLLAGQDIAARDVLWKLYEDGNYAPLWTDAQRAGYLVDVVGQAREEGLMPRDYHHQALVDLRSGGTTTPAAIADLDILLTDSLMRYIYHMYFGKVNPSDLDSDWNLSRRLDRDPTELVTGAIASDDVRQYITDSLNWDPIYEQMKALLAEYRKRAAREGGGYPAIPAGPTLRRGMNDPRVTQLRARLQASGHLGDGPVDDPTLFDATLERAVSAFQTEAEIDVDGAVGAGTLAALNVSLQSRIDQIRVNMERARWILRDIRDSDDFVLVNIAEFKAMLFRDKQQVWETRAQVGRTYRKSPVFRADMKYAQFNPTWTVPPGILRRDILPKLKAGAEDYLQKQDMKLVDSATGEEVAPSMIDWEAASPRNFRYQVVQRPSPDNALGQVKFIFPNPHFVFLHDTNHREHFDDEVRTFSSGCIRIEHPMEFARRVLDDPDWDDAAIQSVIDSKKTRTVYLNEPLPVMILYWTLNPITADGTPEFLPDVYDRDDRILTALEAPFKLVLPDDAPDWLEEQDSP